MCIINNQYLFGGKMFCKNLYKWYCKDLFLYTCFGYYIHLLNYFGCKASICDTIILFCIFYFFLLSLYFTMFLCVCDLFVCEYIWDSVAKCKSYPFNSVCEELIGVLKDSFLYPDGTFPFCHFLQKREGCPWISTLHGTSTCSMTWHIPLY